MKKIAIVLFSTLAVMQLSFGQKPTTGTGNILSVSDIHFNPFADAAPIRRLTQANYTRWTAIFDSLASKTPSQVGNDSNYALFISALKAMQKQNPSPDMIIITGDFLCHEFGTKFSSSAAMYPGTKEAFITKTINYMALKFKQYFPNTVILPVLGNNDSYCGDYKISPTGGFLSMFAKAWVPLQHNNNAAADAAFIRMFSTGGYYTFPLRDGSGGMAILLNTVLFVPGYQDCNVPTQKPALAELAWLKGVLTQASTNKTKLWIVDHVPPGININPTVNPSNPATPCTQNTQLMWTSSFNDTFIQHLTNIQHLTKYSNLIKANFSGHTHMDEFRVLYNATKPVSYVHVTPAISPLFYNNPGFETVTYNKTSLELIDYQTYFLNLKTNATQWAREYDFGKTYGVSAINPASLAKVSKKILDSAAYRNKYILYYNMSYPVTQDNINSTNWKGYWCGIGNFTINGFNQCYCNAPSNQ